MGVDGGSKEELYSPMYELIVLAMAKVVPRCLVVMMQVGMKLVSIPRYATWWGIAFLTLRPDP